MNIFLEHIWIWIVFAAILFIVGWIQFQNVKSIKPLVFCSLGAFALIGLGLWLVYGLQTDRQKIYSTINRLGDAIETNNTDAIYQFIASDAQKTKEKADFYIKMVTINWTKVRELKVANINYYTSPPTASVSFRATVSGKMNAVGTPFTVLVKFTEVVLLKEDDDKWYVTDQCVFEYPGGNSEGDRFPHF